MSSLAVAPLIVGVAEVVSINFSKELLGISFLK